MVKHEVRAVTSIDNDLATGLAAIQRAFEGVQREAKQTGSVVQDAGQRAQSATSHFGGLGASARTLVSDLTPLQLTSAGIGLALADMAKNAVVAGAKLEQTVANISTIKDIDLASTFAQLSDLSTRVPQSALQLAEGLYNIFSSIEVSAEDGFLLLEKLSKGAVAARTDTQTFGTAVVGVMNAYKLSVEDADHVSDVFFNTVKAGAVNGQELASSMGIVTQQAKNAGLSVNELGAAIVAVTKEGGPAAQNINNLANLLAKLPTAEAQQEMHQLGVETQDATGNFRPLGQVIADLKIKLDGMNESTRAATLQQLFPDMQARTALTTMLGQMDAYNAALDTNITKTGAATDAYAKQADTIETKWTLALNKLGEAGNDVFTDVKAPLTALVDFLPTVIEGFEQWLMPWKGILKEQAPAAAEEGADAIYDTLFDLSERAAEQGTATGEGHQTALAEGMADKSPDIYQEIDNNLQAMDVAGDAGDIGNTTGQNYTSLEAQGVAEMRPALAAEVGNNNAVLNQGIDKLNEYRRQVALTGLSGFDPKPPAGGSSATRDKILFGNAPQSSTDSFLQSESEQIAAALGGGGLPVSGPGGTGVGHAAGGGSPTQEELAEGARTSRSIAPKKSGGGGGAGAAERAAEKASEASQQIEQELRLAQAKGAVADAEEHLGNVEADRKKTLEDLKTLAAGQMAVLDQALDTMADKARDANQALQDYTRKSAEESHKLVVQLHDLNEELKRVQEAGKEALQPYIDAAQQAQQEVDKLRAEQAKMGNEFDVAAHDLQQELQPLNDTLAAQEAAVAAVAARYDAELIPRMRELTALNEEQAQFDRADKLHDEAVAIDNLTARLAVATGAERVQLQLQLDKARAQQARDTRKDTLETEIGDLNARKEAEVSAAQAQANATKARIAAIEQEQALLARQRAEFDYQMQQKQLAAQQEADAKAAELKAAQDAQAAKEKVVQDQIADVTALKEKKDWEVQEETRRLSAQAQNAQAAYTTYKEYYDQQKLLIDDKIKKQEAEGKVAEETAKKQVDAAKDVYTALSEAYGIIDKIEGAQSKGAKTTDEMSKALADAHKTVALIVPLLPPLHTGIGNAATSADLAKLAVAAFTADGLGPLTNQLDKTKPETLAGRMAAMFNYDLEGSFTKQFNTSLQMTGNKTALWREGEVRDFDLVSDAVQRLIDKLKTLEEVTPDPPGGELPQRAAGGPVTAGRAYIVGEHGPEVFMSASNGFIHPNSMIAFRGGGVGGYTAAGGGGGTNVNINVTVNAEGWQSKDDIGYMTRKAIKESLQEAGLYDGSIR